MRHGVETTEHDIAWLDTLISAERATLGDADAPEATGPAPAPDAVGTTERPPEKLQAN